MQTQTYWQANNLPMLSEVVRRAHSKAPRTLEGLFCGGMVGALIGGPKGALVLGIVSGIIGTIADERAQKAGE